MSIPFAILVLVFNYIPIWGWTMAFQKYRVGQPFWSQAWVGFDNFIALFQDDRFYLALRNTLGMSILGLMVGFTMPIVFAILINELRNRFFKKTVQTVSYLPHFVSWVVVAGIVYKMLSTDSGPVNQVLGLFGQEPVQFMAKEEYFWGIVVISDLWKELGWNTIIFLAAITAINPELYEAAKMDGAGRLTQIIHVTLPGISNIIIVLLVLSIGNLIAIGFEKQMQLSNPLVNDTALVLDLYALKYGIGMNRFSFGTAIGVVNSIVSLTLLFTANGIFKKRTGQSVM
jgi:putative aldouronate transport system permease protein